MKIKELIIKNIGCIGEEIIKIDKPLMIFYGDIRQGKTTILNSIKLCFGGSYPEDLIKHGETEASVQLKFENSSISRSFYINKDNICKDRGITFIRDGLSINKPVNEIKKLINPFLLDQDYFINLSDKARNELFINLFAIDVSNENKDIQTYDTLAKGLRAEIKAFGTIDLNVVKQPTDINVLINKLNKIKEHNSKVTLKEKQKEDLYNTIHANDVKIKLLKAQINDLQLANKKCVNNLDILKKNKYEIKPILKLEEQISDNKADQIKYDQYQKELIRSKNKQDKEKKLKNIEMNLKTSRQNKLNIFKKISKECPIKYLEFNENGFVFQKTSSDMLSTSQIMILSSLLSDMYPKGLGLELIDKGESLGKHIMRFIKKAEREEKTILATVVGEKPAEVPENIGVFIVENGSIKDA